MPYSKYLGLVLQQTISFAFNINMLINHLRHCTGMKASTCLHVTEWRCFHKNRKEQPDKDGKRKAATSDVSCIYSTALQVHMAFWVFPFTVSWPRSPQERISPLTPPSDQKLLVTGHLNLKSMLLCLQECSSRRVCEGRPFSSRPAIVLNQNNLQTQFALAQC